MVEVSGQLIQLLSTIWIYSTAAAASEEDSSILKHIAGKPFCD